MYSNNNELPSVELEKLWRKLDKLGHEANFEDLVELINQKNN